MFRSSDSCERYEYVSFDLQTPLEIPANNQFQKKQTIVLWLIVVVRVIHLIGIMHTLKLILGLVIKQLMLYMEQMMKQLL